MKEDLKKNMRRRAWYDWLLFWRWLVFFSLCFKLLIFLIQVFSAIIFSWNVDDWKWNISTTTNIINACFYFIISIYGINWAIRRSCGIESAFWAVLALYYPLLFLLELIGLNYFFLIFALTVSYFSMLYGLHRKILHYYEKVQSGFAKIDIQ